MAPLTPGAHDIEQTVEHLPHISRPRPAAAFRRWDERLDQAVLIIAQGLAGAKVPNQNSILGACIAASRMGISALPNSCRRDRSPALNGPDCTFKTGSQLLGASGALRGWRQRVIAHWVGEKGCVETRDMSQRQADEAAELSPE